MSKGVTPRKPRNTDVPARQKSSKVERAEQPAAPQPRPSVEMQGGVSHDAIARRAYALFQERGGKHGGDLDDWLQAEEELAASTRSGNGGHKR
jgi:hypothetical protein